MCVRERERESNSNLSYSKGFTHGIGTVGSTSSAAHPHNTNSLAS